MFSCLEVGLSLVFIVPVSTRGFKLLIALVYVFFFLVLKASPGIVSVP